MSLEEAVKLLEQSAGPFDRACMLVREELAKASKPVSDLSLATREELMAELAKRVEHLLIVSIDHERTKADTGSETNLIYWGGWMCAIGMAQYARDRLLSGRS